jgi:iron complex transport system substrate-binding protein
MTLKISLVKSSIFFSLILCVAIFIVSCNNIITRPQKLAEAKICLPYSNQNTDYFPKKLTVNYATGFTVKYQKNYKIITVTNPWRNAKTSFQYVLLECGTPVPTVFDKTQIITIPVNSAISLSTTHLPHFAKLGIADKLLAVSDTKKVNTQAVVENIKAGKIAEVESNGNLNIERVLELNPNVVITYGTGNPQTDSHPKLLEAGLKVAINAEYMETSPLGRAEWLKFTALFFNKDEIAEKLFQETSQKYKAVVAKVKSIKKRPTVFTGFNFKGTWYAPGCKSYAAKYFSDAGADYLCVDNYSGSIPLSFEDVFARAMKADYWLNLSQSWQTLKDAISEDNRYGEFNAVKKGNVYNNNLRVNSNGGNDYWESGTSNPDVVLSDLVKIMHPELLPNHQLIYYQKLK